MAKTYKVPCVWTMYAVMTVEVEDDQTLRDAIEKAVDECSLPEGSYVDDSFAPDATSEILSIHNPDVAKSEIDAAAKEFESCAL